MKKTISLFIAGLLALALAVPVAAANDKNDVGVEFNPVDLGNTFVQSNQDEDLDLRLVVKLQKTRPNQDLYVEVWCGPDHVNSGRLLYEGEMTTNTQGNGNTGAIIIPKEDLVADCGRPAGERTGHVDVGGFSTTNAELTAPFSWVQ